MQLKVVNQRQETTVHIFFCKQNFPIKRCFICIILGRSWSRDRSRRSGSRLRPDQKVLWLRLRNPVRNPKSNGILASTYDCEQSRWWKSVRFRRTRVQASLDTERALRHTILKQCKLDDIQIPMKKGRLEEIDDDG